MNEDIHDIIGQRLSEERSSIYFAIYPSGEILQNTTYRVLYILQYSSSLRHLAVNAIQKSILKYETEQPSTAL